MDKNTLASLRTLGRPPQGVKNVMEAFLLLIYQPEVMRDWGNCMQKLKTPADVLIKVEQFDPQNCIEATAQKADGLIAGETEESIAKKSFEAAIIYKWTRSMVDKVKSGGGLKA
eukprot:XP_019923690.1 PREDICTED: uncharacterized protein LOC105330377 isoform X3 [Crassostrea gigas]